MGNFKKHIDYGVYAFLFTTVLCFAAAYMFKWPYQLTVAVLPVAFSTTLLGALTPDIDHHKSHPHKTLRDTVTIICAVFLLVGFHLYFSDVYTAITSLLVVPSILVSFGGYMCILGITAVVREGITIFRPPHRGFTHSHTFNLLISLIVFLIVYSVFSAFGLHPLQLLSTSIIVAVSFSTGFLSHQYCDDMIV